MRERDGDTMDESVRCWVRQSRTVTSAHTLGAALYIFSFGRPNATKEGDGGAQRYRPSSLLSLPCRQGGRARPLIATRVSWLSECWLLGCGLVLLFFFFVCVVRDPVVEHIQLAHGGSRTMEKKLVCVIRRPLYVVHILFWKREIMYQ